MPATRSLAQHLDPGVGPSTSVDEVHAHDMRLGNIVFKRSLLRWGTFRARFPRAKVQAALIDVFGERRLDRPDFRTGLLVVRKRLDTGSTWAGRSGPGP